MEAGIVADILGGVMPTRTISRRLIFQSPFTLKPIEGTLPAGAYEVEVDEQEMAGLERSAFVRVATLFIVAAGGTSRTYTVKASDLDAALVGDGQLPFER